MHENQLVLVSNFAYFPAEDDSTDGESNKELRVDSVIIVEDAEVCKSE